MQGMSGNSKTRDTTVWDGAKQGGRRRRRHCGIFARQGFIQENPRKRIKIHTALLSSFILLIICDNWSFIVFFNIKFNQPSKTKKYIYLSFSIGAIDDLHFFVFWCLFNPCLHILPPHILHVIRAYIYSLCSSLYFCLFDPSLALYYYDNIIYMFVATFQHLLYKIVVFLLVALPWLSGHTFYIISPRNL